MTSLEDLSREVTALGVRQEEHIKRVDRYHGETQQVLDRHNRSLYGFGDDPGVRQRLIQLEQFVNSMQKWGNWFKVGVAGLLVKVGFDAFIYFASRQ